jgi:membrane-associated phospholipid phosphatase
MPSRRILALTTIGCATTFVLLAVAVRLGWTDALDSTGRGATSWARQRGLDPALRVVEIAFARAAVSFYVIVLATALLLRRHVRAAAFAVVATLSTALLTTALKSLIGRHRPPWQVATHLIASDSLPSGHATATAALATTVVLLAAHLWQRTITLAASLAGVLTTLVVAADRILLGRHYPTDVVGGTLVGIAVTTAVALASGLGRPSWPTASPRTSRTRQPAPEAID